MPDKRCDNCIHGRPSEDPGWRVCGKFPPGVSLLPGLSPPASLVADDFVCSHWIRHPGIRDAPGAPDGPWPDDP